MSGMLVNLLQSENIKLISLALFVFHFEISGKLVRHEHLLNK